MVTAYIYGTESMNAVAEITGPQDAVERYADDNYDLLSGEIGMTYSPAFGFVDGLNDTEREVISL